MKIEANMHCATIATLTSSRNVATLTIKNHNSTFKGRSSTKLGQNPLLMSEDEIYKVSFDLNEN